MCHSPCDRGQEQQNGAQRTVGALAEEGSRRRSEGHLASDREAARAGIPSACPSARRSDVSFVALSCGLTGRLRGRGQPTTARSGDPDAGPLMACKNASRDATARGAPRVQSASLAAPTYQTIRSRRTGCLCERKVSIPRGRSSLASVVHGQRERSPYSGSAARSVNRPVPDEEQQMASHQRIRGHRIGAGPMGEAERGEAAARTAVSYWCRNSHETRRSFADGAEVTVAAKTDCRRCRQPAGRDRANPPESASTVPYKTHMAYVLERRTQAEGDALVDEALAELRGRRRG
jgi:hypothetical protein